MKIRRGRKIDFEDVLIVPRESKLNSRSEVNLNVEYLMANSGRIWKGIPIIASNMDTVGTIEVYNEFKKYNMCCALHKFYDSETLVKFFNGLESNDNEYVFYTMGITENDIQKYNYVKNKTGSEKIVNVCIDVANGYMDKFLKFVDNFRKENKMVNLMAGNVVTPEACLKLIDVGVDIIKIGIGNGSVCTTRKITGVGYPQLSSLIECSVAVHEKNGFICSDGGIKDPGDFGKAFGAGCFTPDMKVLTENGLKNISDIDIGTLVYTHQNRMKPVDHKFEYEYSGEMISINGIISTPNHEYYVIHKKDKDLVNENNLHEFAFWLPAEQLNDSYLLIDINN
jgi:GMP reductase